MLIFTSMLVFMTQAGIYDTRWYLCYMLACRCWYKVSIYALVLVHGRYLERLHHGEFIGGRYSGSSSARIENRGAALNNAPARIPARVLNYK